MAVCDRLRILRPHPVQLLVAAIVLQIELPHNPGTGNPIVSALRAMLSWLEPWPSVPGSFC
jgi:hypothetical protein